MLVGPIILALALAVASSPGPVPPSPPPPGAADVVRYHRPLRAPVVERFDLPGGPYGPGNRGWEYRTAPGTPVRATAAGTVAFAGLVAGERHVSVLHADGLRSTYSYLATISVAEGDVVAAGQQLGTTTARFQVGFRRDGSYVDPATLFGPLRVRLVPDERFGAGGGAGG